jgi:hypothetical protein
MTSLFSPPPPAYFIPQRALATFSAYLTIEERGTDDLEITQHPIQDGASITDHAFLKPAELSLSIVFSAQQAPLPETYANLLALQASRVPFQVITGKRTYKNMLFRSLGCTTDLTTENLLSISATLQEVLLVNVETITVAPRAKQKNPGVTAATSTTGEKQVQTLDNLENAEQVEPSILQSYLGAP